MYITEPYNYRAGMGQELIMLIHQQKEVFHISGLFLNKGPYEKPCYSVDADSNISENTTIQSHDSEAKHTFSTQHNSQTNFMICQKLLIPGSCSPQAADTALYAIRISKLEHMSLIPL